MRVFGGGRVCAGSGGGAFHAAFAVVAVGGQAVAQQVACAVVLVCDGAGGSVAAGVGDRLRKAHQAVVAGGAGEGAAGGGARYLARAARAVAVGVVLKGGVICGGVDRRGAGKAGDAARTAVLHGPGLGVLRDGSGRGAGAGGAPEFLRQGLDAPCCVLGGLQVLYQLLQNRPGPEEWVAFWV